MKQKISVQLSEELFAGLEATAEQNGKTKSAIPSHCYPTHTATAPARRLSSWAGAVRGVRCASRQACSSGYAADARDDGSAERNESGPLRPRGRGRRTTRSAVARVRPRGISGGRPQRRATAIRCRDGGRQQRQLSGPSKGSISLIRRTRLHVPAPSRNPSRHLLPIAGGLRLSSCRSRPDVFLRICSGRSTR
jgi:hypothetical protein